MLWGVYCTYFILLVKKEHLREFKQLFPGFMIIVEPRLDPGICEVAHSLDAFTGWEDWYTAALMLTDLKYSE